MISKKNALNLPNVSRIRLQFSNFSGGINNDIDENLLPINYAKVAYNTNFKDGALKTGIGFKNLTLPLNTTTGERTITYPANYGNIDGFWVFERYSDALNSETTLFFVHTEDGKIYSQSLYSDSTLFGFFLNWTYSGKPKVLFHKYNNSEVAILASESDYLALWTGNGTPSKIENTLNLTSICLHYERLFATVGGRRNLVRFSEEMDLTEWEESATQGGFIELLDERGQCNKLISFNDYVYIIREHGISRLSAYGDQSSFSVSHLFVSADKIYENTAILCGNRIIFVANDGLYSFNGVSATKYNFKLNSMFNREKLQTAFACYFDGKYYLACNLNFDDDQNIGVESGSYTNNALVEFDLKSGEYNIVRGVDIIHLCPIIDNKLHKLAVIFGDSEHRKVIGEMTNDGCFFGTPMQKNWTSPMSDFGYPNKTKIVREVHIYTKYDITVCVKSEVEQKTFVLKGSDKTQKICPNIKGKRISIGFDCDVANILVSNPNVVVDLVE